MTSIIIPDNIILSESICHQTVQSSSVPLTIEQGFPFWPIVVLQFDDKIQVSLNVCGGYVSARYSNPTALKATLVSNYYSFAKLPAVLFSPPQIPKLRGTDY